MRFNPYGLTISLAIFVAYYLTARRAGRRSLNPDFVWETLPYVLGFGILGARLYHVLNFWSFYLSNPWLIPQVWRGGLGIYGGLVGGLFGLGVKFGLVNYLYSRRSRTLSTSNPPFTHQIILSYLDVAAPAIALAQAVGRLGNVWNGENLPYAWWEMGLNLLIFLVLFLFEKSLPAFEGIKIFNKSGSLFCIYLFLYLFGRFVLEFFRTDSPWIVGPLTMAQWVSLTVIFIILAGLLAIRARKVVGTTTGSGIRG